MAKSNQKTPVVFRLGIILLCCMLFSTYLMGNLYARYTTTASGSDSARVAKFDVVNAIQTATQTIQLHFYKSDMLNDTVGFSVTSSSEVAVKYDVVVTIPTMNSYDWLVVELKLGDTVINGTANGNKFTFSNVGTFSPNDATQRDYTLTFSIKPESQGNPPAGLTNVTDGEVTITVHAEQID